MARCERCSAEIQGDVFEHAGQTLCEDCYMDALNPPKACDPWAVYSAKKTMEQGAQLTELQERMLSLLKEEGPLKPEDLRERLGVSEADFKSAFATLRHMELARGFKEGDQVYMTTFSS